MLMAQELTQNIETWDRIKARTNEEHDRQLRIKSKTNPSHKFCVIGFIKCGQNSLQKFLHKKYPYAWVERAELTWKINGPDEFRERYEEFTPFIITRDPVERIWSSYWYFSVINTKESYSEWLTNGLAKKVNHVGATNPIAASDYELFIDYWKELKPVVLRLEDMQSHPNFPIINKGLQKPEHKMPLEDRELTIQLLKDNGIRY